MYPVVSKKIQLRVHCASLMQFQNTTSVTPQAREGTLAIEDMDGGTFTISNGGVFGSMFGTPIINPPQSAILGMHAIIDRPVVVNGQVSLLAPKPSFNHSMRYVTLFPPFPSPPCL